jgi:hypothetical protein
MVAIIFSPTVGTDLINSDCCSTEGVWFIVLKNSRFLASLTSTEPFAIPKYILSYKYNNIKNIVSLTLNSISEKLL